MTIITRNASLTCGMDPTIPASAADSTIIIHGYFFDLKMIDDRLDASHLPCEFALSNGCAIPEPKPARVILSKFHNNICGHQEITEGKLVSKRVSKQIWGA